MKEENSYPVSGVIEPSDRVRKQICGTTGMAGSMLLVIFAGTTMLKFPTGRNVDQKYNFAYPSCIQYIDLNEKQGISDLGNRTIDLMKVSNLNKIKKMASFCDDWNGTGGSAFSPEAILQFERVIDSLDRQPEIAPTGRNSLLLQYELDDKSLLAFEVSEDRVEKILIPRGDYTAAQAETITENVIQRIKEQVKQFYEFK